MKGGGDFEMKLEGDGGGVGGARHRGGGTKAAWVKGRGDFEGSFNTHTHTYTACLGKVV